MPKRQSPFALVNKNLLNYPIARDPRVKLDWRRSERTGRWLCDLPGADNIQLRLPGVALRSRRRCPTAFDVNVLLLLLCEARKRDTTKLEFTSINSILKSLGYSPEARNRAKVKDALKLWAELMMRFSNWYMPSHSTWVTGVGSTERARRESGRQAFVDPHYKKLELPPPVRYLSIGKRRVRVRISSEWMKYGQRYFARVSLPLPRVAAAQNLVLALLASYAIDGKFGERHTYDRRVRNLCRKIGLNHGDRNLGLQNAVRTAGSWFGKRRIELIPRWQVGATKLSFVLVGREAYKRMAQAADDEEAMRHPDAEAMTDPDVDDFEPMMDPGMKR